MPETPNHKKWKGWVFFRSNNLSDAIEYLYKLIFEFNFSFFYVEGIKYVLVVLIIDYFIRKNERLNFKVSYNIELLISIVFTMAIIWFYNKSEGFIYFQF